MPSISKKGISKKASVRAYVEERGWQRIGAAEWAELRLEFPDVSDASFRGAAGVPIDAPWAGVAAKTLDELEIELIAMAEAYRDAALSRECRLQVIATKDRTRFAVRNPKTPPEKRAVKEEMLEWMLVWLGDPALFATWVTLRKKAFGGAYCNSTEST